MIIRAYKPEQDEDKLMQMLLEEGDEWACYWKGDSALLYRKALAESITYVCYNDERLCGYSRSLNDCGFYIYVCDLLVRPEQRGLNIGRMLMECIYSDYPGQIVYVMSDVDGYYQKQGYKQVGSVFEVTNPVS